MTTYRVDIDGDDELALWRLESGDDWGESIANLYGGHTAVTKGHVPDHGVVFRAAAAVLAHDEGLLLEVAQAMQAESGGWPWDSLDQRTRDSWLDMAMTAIAALRAHTEEATP